MCLYAKNKRIIFFWHSFLLPVNVQLMFYQVNNTYSVADNGYSCNVYFFLSAVLSFFWIRLEYRHEYVNVHCFLICCLYKLYLHSIPRKIVNKWL